MTDHELERLLSLTDPGELRRLYDDAYQMKLKYIGKKVSIRGLIEISNICRKNCYYCGIRSGNRNVKRFQISREEIIETALWAYRHRFASLVLQSGEMMSDEFTEFLESIVREICAKTDHQAGITLSLGEQSPETYRRWREAGATRYLLRIEASDPELYAKLHPADHSYEARVACLRSLRELDYQVGTGVMIGLPGQTVKHLVKDLRFFQEHDIDMIGMGPWLPHHAAPLHDRGPETPERARRRLELSLRMIAATRLQLRDVNIASTTALQAIDQEHGRELGLLFGANVVMPNTGGVEHRKDYTLYDNKPSLDENAVETRDALERSIGAVGETIAYHQDGTPLHYLKRKHPSAEAN